MLDRENDDPGCMPVRPKYVNITNPNQFQMQKEMEEMNELLKRMEAVIVRWKERKKPVQISIPEAEDQAQPGMWYHQIQPGTTVFDFYEGTITFGEVRTQMANALKLHKEEYVRSIRLFVDKDVQVEIDGAARTMIVGGETIVLSEQQFKLLYVKASVPTNIRLFASTATHPIDVNMIAPPVAYAPLYDASTAKANALSIDLGIFSRTIMEIAATATVAVAFTLEASMDNTHWFTIESYGATTSLHKGFANAFRYVRLTNAAGGAGKLDMLIVATSGK